MMKKVFCLGVLLLLIFGLVGCSQELPQGGDFDDTGDYASLLEVSSVNRILIYKVNLSVSTDDLNQMIGMIKNDLNSDEWIDSETVHIHYAEFIIRVKTERLDDFVESLKTGNDVSYFGKTATDISLNYRDTEAKILALELQIERLLELYEEANVSEMILINEQLSIAQAELQKEQGNLNQFDSLIDYSQIELRIYSKASMQNAPFFERSGQAFIDGFNGLVAVFDFLVIALIVLLPTLMIGIPIFIGARFLYVKIKRARQTKNTVNKD